MNFKRNLLTVEQGANRVRLERTELRRITNHSKYLIKIENPTILFLVLHSQDKFWI